MASRGSPEGTFQKLRAAISILWDCRWHRSTNCCANSAGEAKTDLRTRYTHKQKGGRRGRPFKAILTCRNPRDFTSFPRSRESPPEQREAAFARSESESENPRASRF